MGFRSRLLLGYIACLGMYCPIKMQPLFLLMKKNGEMSFGLLFVRLAVQLNVTDGLNTLSRKNIFSSKQCYQNRDRVFTNDECRYSGTYQISGLSTAECQSEI